MKKSLLILFFALITCRSLFSQDIKSMQEDYLEAEYFFVKGDCSDALPIYLNLAKILPDNANLAFKIGVCYLNIPGRKNLSPEYLEKAVKNLSSRYREGTVTQSSAPYDALYELGVAYRINYRFENAVTAFKRYRESLLADDYANLAFVDHEISVCSNAARHVAQPVDFTIKNAGELFNDSRSNFNPVISADGNSFVFMVSEKFYDAVMFSRLANGKWSKPVNITPDLRSDGDMYVSSLSADGKTLFLSRHDGFNSDLWYSSFDGSKWSPAVRLNRNINTKYWESHASVTEDGKTMIFASDRPGGYGGLDLYISKKEKGEWGPAVNLGPEINSPFNEDRPSLIKKGSLLFFASQNHENIGGYDIFRSEKQANGIWSKPVNPGYPFNTPDDNLFFTPAGDGQSGYFSAIRENDGYGAEDIYQIIFK